MRIQLMAIVFACALASCGKPSAMDVCKKIEASGVGANCRASQPAGLGAGAAEKVDFDLPSVAGKTGQVLRFDKEETYRATELSYANMGGLAGPHRYGSPKALIFVQMNEGLSADNGKKVKAIVDAL